MSFESWFYPVLALAGFAALDLFAVNVILVSRWRERGARRTLRLAFGISGAMLIVFSVLLGVVSGIAETYNRHDCDPPSSYEPAVGELPVTTGTDPRIDLPRPSYSYNPPPPPSWVNNAYAAGSMVVAKRLKLTMLVRSRWVTGIKPANDRVYSFRVPTDYRLEYAAFEAEELYDVTYRAEAYCPAGIFSCGKLVNFEPALVLPDD